MEVYRMKYNKNSIELLSEKLAVLKKNDENLSEEEKKKYEKGFQKIKKEIEQLIYDAVQLHIIMNWEFLKEDESEARTTFKKAWDYTDAMCFNPINKQKLLDIAYNSYDIDLIIRQADIFLADMEMELYYPYWKRCCKELSDNDFVWNIDKKKLDYRYYNILANMYYHPTNHIWVNNSENGNGFWKCGGLSPEYEDNIKFNEQIRQENVKKISAFWKKVNEEKSKKIIDFNPDMSVISMAQSISM